MKRIFFFLAALLAVWANPARAQQGTPLYWWTQAGAAGEWQLRTVFKGGTTCPAPATVRAMPSDSFPVLVCQQRLDGTPVQLPGMPRPVAQLPARVQRVVGIGDTGCRAESQDCAVSADWPFAAVAYQAARAGGDLTVHVGDYIYRETAKDCGGKKPCGDNWAAWNADWFAPVGELLPAAPWVFARGNHEDCTRGGRGWFVFFDPRDMPAGGCDGTTQPYAVAVPGVGTLLIMDTACAPWYSTGCWSTVSGGDTINDTTRAVPEYARQFERLPGLIAPGQPAWLVTHVPTWARDFPNQLDSAGAYVLQSALRRASPTGELPAAVGLSLVGHVHAWEGLDFASPRAPVLVLGDGGTSESVGLPPALGSPAGGVAVDGYWAGLAFGYTVLQSTASGWTVTLVPVSGTGTGMTCTLTNSQLVC